MSKDGGFRSPAMPPKPSRVIDTNRARNALMKKQEERIAKLESLTLRVVTVEEIKAECDKGTSECRFYDLERSMHSETGCYDCLDSNRRPPCNERYTIPTRPIYTDGTSRYVKLGR
jgi:hypothetical protein